MTATGRGAVWAEDGLRVVDRQPGPVADGWARVRVAACGICGGDLHSWRDPSKRRIGTTPGHEIAGTVVTGPDDIRGRLCAVSPNVTCGRCEFCLAGTSNLCRRGGYGIGLGRDGGIADYVDCPVENLYPVDESVSPVVASLSEPLAVCYRAVRLAKVDPSSRVMILGGGTLGLLSLILTARMVREVGVTVRYPHQKELVESLGGIALGEGDWQEWAKKTRPDAVIETVGGAGETIETGIRAIRRGGRMVVLGSFGRVPVDIGGLMFKEVTVVGSFAYGWGARGAEFAAAVELLPSRQYDLASLQRDQFKLGSAEDAFRCAADKSTGAVKVTVTP